MGGILRRMSGRTHATGGDPNFANVVFLSGYEGGSIIDESPLAQTVSLVSGISGAPSATNSEFLFGTQCFDHGSLRGPASVPDHASFINGTSPFTIESGVNFQSTGNIGQTDYLVSQWDNTSGTVNATDSAWYFARRRTATSTHKLVFGMAASTTLTELAFTWAGFSRFTWHQLAVDFDGTTYRVYANGSMLGSDTTVITINNATAALSIGAAIDTGGTQADSQRFSGYMDETRVTAAVARYASNGGYTPAIAAFPRS